MGFLNKIKQKRRTKQSIYEYFKMMTAYEPAFTTFEGGLYEMELTRAVIHSFATHVSKLKPEVQGKNNEMLERMLQYKPNPYQDTTKFLYRLATILQVQNNAFIVPLYADDMETITGYYPILPSSAKIKEINGTVYLIYNHGFGGVGAIEFDKVGVINQFYYKDEFFGENNRAFTPTLELLNSQKEAIIEGVKSSAYIRFVGKFANTLKEKDIEAEKKKFAEFNLSSNNTSGVLFYDSKIENLQQVNSTPFIVDAQQMALIKENVFNYFGTNENILQNKFTSDEWNAYYEGKIEPFAIQTSLVMTNMTFNTREIAFGNGIILTANRLQYLSNQEKLNTVTQLFDRGFITHNEGLEIFNMPSIGEDGDKRYIRKEYAEKSEIEKELNEVGSEKDEEE